MCNKHPKLMHRSYCVWKVPLTHFNDLRFGDGTVNDAFMCEGSLIKQTQNMHKVISPPRKR